MAAKPIERFVKRQIQEQGGWPRILERIASGETYSQIARSLKRPDGEGISFAFFRRLLHQDPAREALIREAKRIRAEAWADDALAKSDAPMATQVDVGKARVQIDARLRLAGFADREQYGERKQVEVAGGVAVWHVDALRHRIVEVSRPLAAMLGDGSAAEIAGNGGHAPVEHEHSLTERSTGDSEAA